MHGRRQTIVRPFADLGPTGSQIEAQNEQTVHQAPDGLAQLTG